MTQRELADVAQVAQSTIARIESGARQPSLPLLARVLAGSTWSYGSTWLPTMSTTMVLDATEKRLSLDKLERRRKSQDAFASALRQRAPL